MAHRDLPKPRFDSLLCMLNNNFTRHVTVISFDILPNWNDAAINTSVKDEMF